MKCISLLLTFLLCGVSVAGPNQSAGEAADPSQIGLVKRTVAPRGHESRRHAAAQGRSQRTPDVHRPAQVHDRHGRGTTDGRGFDGDHRSRYEFVEGCEFATGGSCAESDITEKRRKTKAKEASRAMRAGRRCLVETDGRETRRELRLHIEAERAHCLETRDLNRADAQLEGEDPNPVATEAAGEAIEGGAFQVADYDAEFPSLGNLMTQGRRVHFFPTALRLEEAIYRGHIPLLAALEQGLITREVAIFRNLMPPDEIAEHESEGDPVFESDEEDPAAVIIPSDEDLQMLDVPFIFYAPMTLEDAIREQYFNVIEAIKKHMLSLNEAIHRGLITIDHAIKNGLISLDDAFIRGFITVEQAIELDLITVRDAIYQKLILIEEAIRLGYLDVQEALDEGLITIEFGPAAPEAGIAPPPAEDEPEHNTVVFLDEDRAGADGGSAANLLSGLIGAVHQAK